ncbi:MAG TPA: lipopolysaccharide kinase InaA family protein [Candidatus Binataceae bacterium]|nr:lipopolysaccharide kinase InaA family protein [Candidatus Binataceae bacterium]
MRTQVLYAREPRWREVAERAEELIRSSGFTPVKSEGRTLAGVLRLADGSTVFIKRSAPRSWLRAALMPIAGSPAVRALKGAAMLDAAEIPHPSPLAAAETVGRGAVHASYLVSEALLDGDTLSRFALGPGEIKGRDARRRRRILDSVARQVRRIHDAGLYTRDLQETNVMVADDEGQGFRVWFLDLEDFRRLRRVGWPQRARNLIHLDRSIGRFLCRAARLAFLYAYLGGKPEHAEARRLVHELLVRRAQMERHHARRATVTLATTHPARTEASGVDSVRG